MTRLVHTADWHLGARLIDCDRHEEHCRFLDWFLVQLCELRPDLLIVAGDIFDSPTPPQEALNLYYRFLARLAGTVRCRVLVLGGNHDSPATLHAPREILAALEIRVIASPPAEPKEALLEFPDAVVCAVPYLRERDVRTALAGETADQVAQAIRSGVAKHYRTLCEAARAAAGERVLIGTGHLTAVGCAASPSERMIHIGNLGAVEAGCFDGFAYTALGHIHRPQPVGREDCVRYAGSPIPLSFAEADLAKEFRVIEIEAGRVSHRGVAIPAFRALHRLTAAAANLGADLAAHQGLESEPLEPWVEVTVSDGYLHPDLDRQVRDAAGKMRLRVLKILSGSPASEQDPEESETSARCLADLRFEEVFAERLRRAGIDPGSEAGQALMCAFAELVSGMHDQGESSGLDRRAAV